MKNDTKFFNLDKVKLQRKSRNEHHKFYGEFKLFQNWTEEVIQTVELYKKQGGEYRITPYHLKGRVCYFIEVDDTFYKSIANATGLPKKVIRFNFPRNRLNLF